MKIIRHLALRRLIIAALAMLVPAVVVRGANKITSTNVDRSSVTNSTVDSSPIGSSTPSTGVFTQVQANSHGTNSTQGAYLEWNINNGQGDFDFVNNRGAGGGGFEWYNATSSGVLGSPRMILDPLGDLSITGNMTGGPPSTASFGGLAAIGNTGSVAATLPGQGSIVLWNQNVGAGDMDFVDLKGTGGGGFNFYVTNSPTALGSPVMVITGAGEVVAVAGFQGNLIGNVTGTATTATTASAFAGTPATCVNELATGIHPNGDAYCIPVPNAFPWIQAASTAVPFGSYNAQGAYMGWNTAGAGETDFLNNYGLGAGGFLWQNTNGPSTTSLMELDNTGKLTTGSIFTGNVTATSETVNGTMTAQHVSAPNIQSASSGGCSTGNTDTSTCTSSVSWPSNFPDTNYSASCMINGPFGHPHIEGYTKTTSGITVTIANGSNSAAISSGGALDCIAQKN